MYMYRWYSDSTTKKIKMCMSLDTALYIRISSNRSDQCHLSLIRLTEHFGVPAVSSRVDSFPIAALVPEAVESTHNGVTPEHAAPVVPQTHAPEVHLLWVDSVQLDVEH